MKSSFEIFRDTIKQFYNNCKCDEKIMTGNNNPKTIIIGFNEFKDKKYDAMRKDREDIEKNILGNDKSDRPQENVGLIKQKLNAKTKQKTIHKFDMGYGLPKICKINLNL